MKTLYARFKIYRIYLVLETQNPECESVRDFTFSLLLLRYYLESHSGFW